MVCVAQKVLPSNITIMIIKYINKYYIAYIPKTMYDKLCIIMFKKIKIKIEL